MQWVEHENILLWRIDRALWWNGKSNPEHYRLKTSATSTTRSVHDNSWQLMLLFWMAYWSGWWSNRWLQIIGLTTPLWSSLPIIMKISHATSDDRFLTCPRKEHRLWRNHATRTKTNYRCGIKSSMVLCTLMLKYQTQSFPNASPNQSLRWLLLFPSYWIPCKVTNLRTQEGLVGFKRSEVFNLYPANIGSLVRSSEKCKTDLHTPSRSLRILFFSQSHERLLDDMADWSVCGTL